MDAIIFLLLSVIFILFNACHSYITISRHLNPCEKAGNTEAVEHFFNMVFTEFHNSPPACICVQMCIEHPTYCYPNGCLKRPEKNCVETKSAVDNVLKNVGTPKSVMFLVENRKDFVDEINNNERKETPQPMELIYKPNPFKELVFKYKKVPKLQMRYNLKEQVKNMKYDKLKRDQIDLLKTRWPTNKHLLNAKQPFHGIGHYKRNYEKGQSKFFASIFPELEKDNYTPKVYNKFLTKRENNDAIKYETLYVYKTDVANFSLEALIDSLIENSLDRSTKTHDSNISELNEIDNISEIIRNHDLFETKGNYSNSENTVNVISINSTNENVDTNDDLTNTTNDKGYLEMIAIMTEKIDKQNEESLDLMERVTGNRDIFNNKSIIDSTRQQTAAMNTNVENISLRVIDNNIVTTNPSVVESSVSNILSTISHNPVIKKPFKKSKQRIVRKLHSKKININN